MHMSVWLQSMVNTFILSLIATGNVEWHHLKLPLTLLLLLLLQYKAYKPQMQHVWSGHTPLLLLLLSCNGLPVAFERFSVHPLAKIWNGVCSLVLSIWDCTSDYSLHLPKPLFCLKSCP